MQPAVEIKNLHVELGGSPVLKDINFSLPTGEVVGLLGPSGSGKTTLMRTIMGLQAAKTGSVAVFNQPAGAKQLRPEIGYMAQNLSVYPDLTVAENLRYFASINDVDPSQVEEIMARVELKPQADQLVSETSGGQKARVSLAIALLHQPKLLILDEPTVGLDPVLRRKLWRRFHHLADNGVTLLVSSHVMDEAEQCDSLLFLRQGHLIADATLEELKTKTNTDSAEAAFLSLVGAHAS